MTTRQGEATASAAEMMAELDAIAATHGITWSGAEVANVDTSTRTRYATPGTACGRGTVRQLSDAQLRFIQRLMTERDTSKLVLLPGAESIEHMSLAGARDLIERLLACPERSDCAAPALRLASEKQRNFLRKLLAERSTANLAGPIDVDTIGAVHASQLIEHLLAQPRVESTTPTAELEAAIYLFDGDVYKVQRAVHGSGRMYAKILDRETGRFEFASGAIRNLRAEHKMTLAQAKEFGAIYGMCCVCGATLTDEVSIAAGIGPICASKF